MRARARDGVKRENPSLGRGRVSLPATIAARDYDGSASHESDEFSENAIPPDGISRPVSGRMNRFSRAPTRASYVHVSYVPPSRRDCNVDATRRAATRPTAPRHSSCLDLTAVSSSSARSDGNLMAYSPRNARSLAHRAIRVTATATPRARAVAVVGVDRSFQRCPDTLNTRRAMFPQGRTANFLIFSQSDRFRSKFVQLGYEGFTKLNFFSIVLY